MELKVFDGYFTRLFGELIGELDHWAEGFDALGFSRRYRRVMEQRHSSIKILGMAKPVPISSIYLDLWARREIPSRFYLTIEEVSRRIYARHNDLDYALFEAQSSRITTSEFLRNTKHALVLGQPGSGKTTLMKHLTMKLLSQRPPFEAFPIFISLREFADSPHDSIIAFAVADAEKNCSFQRRTAEPFFERLLSSGRAAILLDGLDEVEVARRPAVVTAIEKLLAQFPESHCIISCRTFDYQGWFTKVEEVEIAAFSRKQVDAFASKWFRTSPERTSALLKIYDDQANIRELCSTPLLSALVCILFQYNIQLPQNRAELYSECIDALLFKWDASRLIERTSKFAELSTARKKALLAEVGYRLTSDQLVVTSKEQLVGFFATALKRYGLSDADDVLREIVSHHALLLERSAGMWSFMHLTFQEYFAALYVVQNRSELQLVKDHFYDPRWREVLLMVASLLPDPDSFLTAIRIALLASKPLRRIRQLASRLWAIASRPWGLKEAKDLIESDHDLLGSKLGGAKKINQIKAVRQLGSIFGIEDLASTQAREGWATRYGHAVPPWSAQHLKIFSNQGEGAGDSIWADVSEFADSVRLFGDACRQSLLGAALVQAHIDEFLKGLQEGVDSLALQRRTQADRADG